MGWQGDALARTFPEVGEVLIDVVGNPDFAVSEFEKLKREMKADIVRIRDHDRSLNRRFYDRYLFGAHPYGRPVSGTLDGIDAIVPEDGAVFHKAHVHTGSLVVGFSGDVTRAVVDGFLDKLAAVVPKGAMEVVPLVRHPTAPTGRQVLLVDKPGRTQNQILLGHFGPRAGLDDIYAMDVVNTVFGGTFTARLNQEIRDDRGLSYAAYSYLEADRSVGTFTLWTFPDRANSMKTLDLLVALLDRLDREALTEEEVEFAKRYLIESFAFRIDTPDDLLTESMRAELHGHAPDFVTKWTERIAAVTVEDANRVRENYIDADNFLISMLCTAASFEEPVRMIQGVTTVTVVTYDTPF
jgi:zinc protease